jgi:TP901 family phage tail tape measure protein/lambda family phage tail tape measure protein
MANKSMGTLTLWLRGDATQLIATMATVEKTLMASAAKMRSIGISMSMYLTAPILLVGTSMAKGVMEFDEAMNKSVAIMGAQGQEMRAEMEKTAIDISKTTTTTAVEMADAYFFLASAGLNAEQSIKALAVVEKFAVAGSFDMAKATTLAMDSQAALGMKSKDATINMMNLKKVTDLLVGANTLANASTEQFAIALTHGAGAAMKNFGIEVEDGIAILAAYADQGIKAERAGNMFSRMIRLQTAGVIRNQKAWESFNVDIYDSNRNLRPLTELVKDLSGAFEGLSGEMIANRLHMLGFKARSQQAIFPLLGMTEKTKEFMEALQDMDGMAEEVANDRLTSLSSQLEIAKNNMKAAGLAMKDELIPYLESLNKILTDVGNWWEESGEEMHKAAIKWGLIIAAAGPVLILLSFIVKMLGTLVGGVKGTVIAITWLGTKFIWLVGILKTTSTALMAFMASSNVVMTSVLGTTMGTVTLTLSAMGMAIISVGLAIHQLLVTLGLLEGVGFGDYLIEKYKWIAVASAEMGTAVAMSIEKIKYLWVKFKISFERLAWKIVDVLWTALGFLAKPWEVFIDGMLKGVTWVINKVGDLLVALEKAYNAIPKLDDIDLGGEKLQNLELEFEMPDMAKGITEAIEKGVKDADTSAIDALFTAEATYLENVQALTEGLVETLDEVNERFDEHGEKIVENQEKTGEGLDATTKKVGEQISKFEAWAIKNFASVGKKIEDYANKAKDIWGNITDVGLKAFDTLGDGITELITGGEFDLRQFAANIIKELIGIMVKAILVRLALSYIPGMATIMQSASAADQALAPAQMAAGGAQALNTARTVGNYQPSMADATGPRQYHTGGVIGQGQLQSDERVIVAQTGEVMLSRDDVRDARDEEGPNQSAGTTIINVLDKSEMIAALATPEGERTVLNVMRRNRGTISGMMG